jgi:hypothetical protein
VTGETAIALLGPQHVKPTVGQVLRDIGVRGPIALVTAGWQEREGEDEAIALELGRMAVNLTLHARADDVFARDQELAAAYKQRQQRLRRLQDFYRVRLEHAEEAARVISLRHVDPDLLADEERVSLELVRRLDEDHLERCRQVHAEFAGRWRPAERDRVALHRSELRETLASCDAVVIAGGHVAVLLNRLKLFDLVSLLPGRVIAWSAGAMALSEKVVLFHDDPPHGVGVAEILDAGLGLVTGIVVLPDPRRRLRLADRERMARFARRFAPAVCVPMDQASRIDATRSGLILRPWAAPRLTRSGALEAEWRP